MKQVIKFVTVVLAVCLMRVGFAEETFDRYPIGISLLPVRYLEAPSPDSGVWLFRLNLLAGYNRSMTGFDLGTIGNWAKEDVYGLAFAGGYNVCGGEGAGLQLSCVNFTERGFGGVQMGLVNLTWGISGLQLGIVNATSEGGGLQIGLVNLAESFSGFQLGLLNMNQDSPLMMMPILNVWF